MSKLQKSKSGQSRKYNFNKNCKTIFLFVDFFYKNVVLGQFFAIFFVRSDYNPDLVFVKKFDYLAWNV